MTGKLLSDSGVTVIATKIGSSQNASTDVKYVVKKQESPTEMRASGQSRDSSGTSQSSEGLGSLLMSFDELLGSSGNTKSSESSGFISAGNRFASEKVSSGEQITLQPVTKTTVDRNETTSKARSENATSVPNPRPQSLGKAPARVPQLPSKSRIEQTISTKPTSPVQGKSSIKDFLATFSPKAEKKDQDKEKIGSTNSEENKSSMNLPVKTLFSKFSHSDGAVRSPTAASSAKKSPSLDPFASLLDDAILPDDDSDKEKEAETTSTLASGITFGSSLGSSDPWSLLLDELGRKSSSSASKMEIPGDKVKDPVGKVTESAFKVKDAGQGETDEARLSPTASVSRSMIRSSILTRSLEVGFQYHTTCTRGTMYLPDTHRGLYTQHWFCTNPGVCSVACFPFLPSLLAGRLRP